MIPIAVWAVLAGVFGLAIGSFLNVVIYRVPAGESVVSPPSRCPSCGAEIRNRHNVPVLGWLMLRGRCYDCRTPISPRYPLVEGATGVLFAAVTFRVLQRHLGWALPVALWVVAVAIVVSLVAVDRQRLPRKAVIGFTVVGLVLSGVAAATHDVWAVVTAVLATGALAGLASRRRPVS
jgi:leader peptidase (prepilin peptidase) / N-methyltransferase